MIEVLPIRLLTEEDAPVFGSLNVTLGKLLRSGLPVSSGIVVTAPNLKLKTILEHYNFGTKEVFTQSITLIQKEINKIPVPQILIKEIGQHKSFFVNGVKIKSVKDLWLTLLNLWLEQIKSRLWNNGFYPGVTENLEPKIVVFAKKIEAFGTAFKDSLQDDVVINCKFGKLSPSDLKKIAEIVQTSNKKLFIPHEHEWVLDSTVKLVGIKPYTPQNATSTNEIATKPPVKGISQSKKQSTIKVFFDLSTGFALEKDADGVYIASEKIFDLNKPQDSFEKLVLKLVESAETFPNLPVFFKLADKSEGMGKVRGALRLLHQSSLFNPLVDALDFVRHKKALLNVHVVIPYVRGISELLQVKRELAIKKLMRKNSLKILMEAAVLENIVNLEDYLLAGIDGVVLNLDELIAHLNGFDPLEENLAFYKNEVEGLLKFLEDGVKILHKLRMPFIAYGSLALNPKVLEFLVERGVYGVVVERYEAHSIHELLNQTERRMFLRKS
ncbi:hypothetical protein M1437_00650 [Patescibacteria group bacterium]|nr:hypothetical protein [Patescibacteria group bacterium]